MTDEVVCAVPDCDNLLTEEERKKNKVVCSSCEVEGSHLCGLCGREMRPSRIRNGAVICRECEMYQPDFQDYEAELSHYGSEYDPEEPML